VEKAKQVAPKLRDMVIMMLTSLSFEEVMTPEGKIRIRDELLERFNQVMRPDRIKNIYFTEFVVQ
jgi:flagellar FliL protein